MRDRLTQRQRDLGWVDRQMAEVLGIHRSTWTAIRLGNRPLTLTTIRRAVAHFPDMARYALD